MTTLRPIRTRAFTIIELMLVIAIMAIVAGLIVWGAARASETKKVTRTQVESARLVTLIEAYRHKLGVYPPQNTNDPAKNTLVYELAGAIRLTNAPYSDANPGYQTPFGTIAADVLLSEFGVRGIVNSFTPSVDDVTEFRRFLKSLKPDQVATTGPNNVLRLVIPVDDPNGNRPNFWSFRYPANETDQSITFHNRETFDLWVDITARSSRTNLVRRIGNWKD